MAWAMAIAMVKIRIRSKLCRTRYSVSLGGSGSVLTIWARMVWEWSTLVRWDASCGVFRQLSLRRANGYSWCLLLCFRLYLRLDASRPVAKESIQTLHTLVVQFTRHLVQRAITLRQLDFALRAHTKVWRLGERVVRPPHVCWALELCGGAQLSVHMHFRRLAERFSEGEESEDEDDDEDVPLIVRAQMRMAKAIASKEDEDANTSDGEREQQQQQAGPTVVKIRRPTTPHGNAGPHPHLTTGYTPHSSTRPT
jgi:hypothetical protein